MYSVRNRVDTGFATSLSRRVGAAHLGVAGLINVAIGVEISGMLGSETAFLSLLSLLEGRWAESELLTRGETLSFLVGTVAPVLVVIALIVGLIQLGAAILAATGRGYALSIAAAFAGVLTLVTIPLCLTAGILCWCSEDQFRGRSSGWLVSLRTRSGQRERDRSERD